MFPVFIISVLRGSVYAILVMGIGERCKINVKSKRGKKLCGLKVERILAFSMLFTVSNRPW